MNERDAVSAAPSGWLRELAQHARDDAAKVVHDALARGLTLPGYRILELIGAGGQGAVFHATDLASGVDVALKVMPCAPGDDDETRFEATSAKGIDHPNVCRVNRTDVVSLAGHTFRLIEMAYVGGGTLAARLAREPPLTTAEASAIFRGVCSGLQAAHAKSVLHLDLKPSNILLREDLVPVISDFGLGARVGEESRGMFTRDWAAPEVEHGDEALAEEADIYALGRLLNVLFPERSVGLSAVIALASASTPGERFPDVAALLAAFEFDQTIRAERRRRWRRRGIGAGLVAIALLVAVVVYASRGDRRDQRLAWANALLSEYRDVTTPPKERYAESDFEGQSAIVSRIFAVDPNNGHAFYFRALKTRALHQNDRNGTAFRSSHQDLRAYLEEERRTVVPPGLDKDACYKHSPHGYCVQRTAWIHHLLALDFHRSACLAQLAEERDSYFVSALDHAKKEKELYGGFVDPNQGPTDVLLRQVTERSCESVRR